MILRTAVVGVGYLGTFHAQKYKNNPSAQLIGVYDPNKDQALQVAKNLGVIAFADLESLVSKVDAVTIAASTKAHFDLAEFFLKKGIHVNVEKPITASIPQAEQLIALAQKNRLKLAVGHIERFNPCLLELKQKAKSIQSLHLVRHATFKPRGADVDVLWDLMIHDLDLMHWLTGSDLEAFMASGQNYLSKDIDAARVFIRTCNKIDVVIDVSRVASQMSRSVQCWDKENIYHINTATQEVQQVSGSAIINKNTFSNAAQAAQALQESTQDKVESNLVDIQSWTVPKADALQKETDAFVDCILQDTEPVVSGVDGLKALLTLDRIQKSIWEQRR